MRRTKIVATIGPASRSAEALERLVAAGADVLRLNFSHGTHEEHLEVIRTARSIAAALDKPIALLQDLSGPKIRTGRMLGGQAELTARLAHHHHDRHLDRGHGRADLDHLRGPARAT